MDKRYNDEEEILRVDFIQKMPETNDKLVELLTPALIKYRQMTSRHDQ